VRLFDLADAQLNTSRANTGNGMKTAYCKSLACTGSTAVSAGALIVSVDVEVFAPRVTDAGESPQVTFGEGPFTLQDNPIGLVKLPFSGVKEMTSVPCIPGCKVKALDTAWSEKSAAGFASNVAVIDSVEFTVIMQEPVPEQPPPQPAKADPGAAEAIKVTTVPPARLAEHEFGQLMAGGLLVTTPAPVPASTTERVKSVGVAAAPSITVTLSLYTFAT
jgi:hypothetical protein